MICLLIWVSHCPTLSNTVSEVPSEAHPYFTPEDEKNTGQGSRKRIFSTYARSYAVVAPPCATACAPFKSSPATYATCCKQHAAAAPKPKPVAAKPVSNIIKSTRPKPLTTGQLHQGQVTFYDKIGDPNLITNPGLPPPRPYTGPIMNARPNVTNTTYNFPQGSPMTGAPSGGGSGKIFGPEIRCQTGCNKQCGKGGCCVLSVPPLVCGPSPPKNV
jgi:hypothetical protein